MNSVKFHVMMFSDALNLRHWSDNMGLVERKNNILVSSEMYRLASSWILNSFPNDKILDRTKLKAVADDKLTKAEMTIFIYDWSENIVGKGENAG